jgi:hypothetical protein
MTDLHDVVCWRVSWCDQEIAASGYSGGWFKTVLKSLVDSGRVVKIYNMYQLPSV